MMRILLISSIVTHVIENEFLRLFVSILKGHLSSFLSFSQINTIMIMNLSIRTKL